MNQVNWDETDEESQSALAYGVWGLKASELENAAEEMGENFDGASLMQSELVQRANQTAATARRNKLERTINALDAESVVEFTGIDDQYGVTPEAINALEEPSKAMQEIMEDYREEKLVTPVTLEELGLYEA